MKQVLSVSRRSDIPAFYMPWFMEGVARGTIEVVNPFNGKTRAVAVTPERVHTLVFWSKNFGPFLQKGYGERLQAMGYHLLFNFTLNSRSSLLEPGVPGLNQRLDQLRQLVERFGTDSVHWRFDPICHFIRKPGVVESNLGDFETIAERAGNLDVKTCTTSFMDAYRKIDRRVADRLTFVALPVSERVALLLEMERILSFRGIRLCLCCETALLRDIPQPSAITAGACIDGKRIMAVHGGRVSSRQDASQRKSAGCRCTLSIDVGSYCLHPCHHNCLFCYANPACDGR